jgi:pimeloyl-ACP methyl ester carboxylesterase
VTTTFDATSADGTVVRGWDSEQPGVPLVVSNGLGSVPSAWPALLAESSGYRTLTWYHRGTFATPRPADPSHVRVQDHVDDLLAVMDARGVERAVVASWSIGVNVAFEAARLHPDRVAGLLAVAGVPGGTFATMGGPLGIPRPLRAPVGTRVAKLTRLAGPVLSRLTPLVPVDARTAWLLSHSGFMLPGARSEHLVPMLREFLQQDWGWYMTLAVGAAEHPAMDTSFLACPITFVAGRSDVLTSVHDVVEAAGRIPSAEVVVLPGSHFLTLEHPEQVHAALDALVARTGLAQGRS